MSKRVLVTGAAGGIGRAAVEELRGRGARVIGLDLNGDDEDVLAADVRDQESVDAAVEQAIERLGGLDVLVNNAGIGDVHDAGARPDDEALAVLDVNLVGPWRVTGAAMPALLESRGRVVNVASGLAHVAVPFSPAYCMSKRGLVAYSDTLRLEYGSRIAVTTVYPGYIDTPIHNGAAAKGIALEGLVPKEDVHTAGRAVARAALDRPVRDLATTRNGSFNYLLARHVPRRLLDAAVGWRVRRHVRKGGFAQSEQGRRYRERLNADAPASVERASTG